MKKYIIFNIIALIITIAGVLLMPTTEPSGPIASAELHEIGYDVRVYSLSREEIDELNKAYVQEDFLSAEPIETFMQLHSAIKLYNKDGIMIDKFYVCINGDMYNEKFHKVQDNYSNITSLMKELIKYN